MNKVCLSGRLTRDPMCRYKEGEQPMCIARFTIAVDRRRARSNAAPGEQTADFISCVAFGKTAEFIEKYARKGMKFDLTGRIQTGSYQSKDNQTVYTTDVVVEDIEFGESRKARGENSGSYQQQGQNFPPQEQNSSQQNPFGQQTAQSGAPSGAMPGYDDSVFMDVPPDVFDELPFN